MDSSGYKLVRETGPHRGVRDSTLQSSRPSGGVFTARLLYCGADGLYYIVG
jgi:hypothetical protein